MAIVAIASLILVDILGIVIALNSNSFDYECQRDIKIKRDQDWLLSSFKTSSKIACIANCNSNINCVTVVFSQIESTNGDNCLLYRKYFELDLLQASEGSILFSKKCVMMTTINDTRCASRPKSFLEMIGNTQPKHVISSHPVGSFGFIHGIVEHFDGTTFSNIVIDYGYQMILKFNQNWEFISNVNYSNPAYGLSIYKEIFITFDGFVRKFDETLTVLAFYFEPSARYRGICYDYLKDLLYVTDQSRQLIESFNRNLTKIGVFNTSSYNVYSLNYFNGYSYVGVHGKSELLMIQNNNLIERVVDTLCSMFVTSIQFDGFGYFVALCRGTAQANIFDLNGNYTGTYFAGQTTSVGRFIHLDERGRLILASDKSIYFFY